MKEFKSKLDEEINKSSKIFIVGHNEADFDSIGACIGMNKYIEHFNKKAYIVLNDSEISLDLSVKGIIDNSELKNKPINKEKACNLIDDNSLLIVVDVNKIYRICFMDTLNKFKNIIVIDHHDEDKNSIDSNIKYIDTNSSSASEIITKLLSNSKISYDSFVSNCLLAGIVLDTKRFMKNTTSSTYDITKKLLQHGADPKKVNELFLSEFDDEATIAKLIYNNGNTLFSKYSKNIFKEYNISFTLNRENPDYIYKRVYIAKAADKMLKIKMIDASFVIGRLNDKTIVSARSTGEFNVGEILEKLDTGGGNAFSAGGESSLSPIELEDKIRNIIMDKLSENYEKTDIYPNKRKKVYTKNKN